jgi:hypothetical protein
MRSSERRSASWPLITLLLGIAGLALMAPLAWKSSQPANRTGLAAPGDQRPSLSPSDAAELQSRLHEGQSPSFAPLGPLVADQIDFDPSITQTPALPVSQPLVDPTPALNDPSGPLELKPAATTLQPQFPDLPRSDLSPAEPLAELDPGSIVAEPEPAPAFPETKAWPYPAGLVEQLNVLAATTPEGADWAERARAEIEQFVQADSLAASQTPEHLSRLQQLADEARKLALAQPDESDARSKLLRAGYSIVRRITVWEAVHALAVKGEYSTHTIDRDAWQRALGEIDSQLQATGAAKHWRNYLLIDRAREMFDSSACTPADQRELARNILHRLHSSQLSHEQEEFLKSPHFVAFDQQLKARADEAPDLFGLLTAIEHHEHDDTSANARGLAAAYESLRWAADPQVAELAETVNTYYRNANVRIALSVELINRLIPQQRAQVEPVQDNILGAYVEGQSHTRTRLRLVLLPDRSRWQVGLEAEGQVDSDTASSKGPATFYQYGNAFFRARKRLTVDRRGIRVFNAEANAQSHNNLSDFETDFDGIPLLSNFARAMARSEYDDSQYDAKMEVEGRIVSRARTTLDRQVAERLQKAQADVQTKVITPLQKLNLEPTPVDLETTAERLIARYRLAGREQISAHTPRPQAPGDSLISVQMHETAMNNILESLDLHGRRLELRELFKEITTRFNREPVAIPEDLPENVYVTFADEDPVRLDCQDGRVRLTIRLKELDSGKNKWNNFAVRGYYVPNPDQRDANLVREGVIELIGEKRLGIGDQVALRGIFARVLSRNRKLNLVNKQIAQAPELADQQVTQFIIHDGWIGIALGPQTPGRRVAMHPRPKSGEGTEIE